MQDTFTLCLDGRADIYSSIEEYLKVETLEKFQSTQLHIVDLCHAGDLRGEGSVKAIARLREKSPETEIVVLSGISDVQVMRSCLAAGADRYLLKDHIGDELPLILSQLQEKQELKVELDALMVGESHPIRDLKRDLLECRLSNSKNILIEGESGSGKEICANFLHKEGPFIAVNVAAIPKDLFEAEFFGSEKGAFTGAHQSRAGYLEAAEGGTLFLDEVQSLDASHQAKLLRVLETKQYSRVGTQKLRPFNARLLCACNASLPEMIQKDQFREDLYYRIAVLHMRLPSLRSRRRDFSFLIPHFLRKNEEGAPKKMTGEGIQYLSEAYDWPGNVRELKAFLEKAVLKIPLPILDQPELQKLLTEHDADMYRGLVRGDTQNMESFQVDWEKGFDDNISALEAYLLRKTLEKHKGVEARELLSLGRSRFYEKLKLHNISRRGDVSC